MLALYSRLYKTQTVPVCQRPISIENIVIIIQKHHEYYGNIRELNQLQVIQIAFGFNNILMLIVLLIHLNYEYNRLNKRCY